MSDAAVAPDATATTSKLEEVAASIGSRIWEGNTSTGGNAITTEASAHVVVIANVNVAQATATELRREINRWMLREHGDELAKMSWDERSTALDWAIKPV